MEQNCQLLVILSPILISAESEVNFKRNKQNLLERDLREVQDCRNISIIYFGTPLILPCVSS